MSSINTSINMLNGALRAPVFFNCLPRHRSEAHKFFTAQQPVASSNVQWKKTGENEWLIKHSCVKLNHCSENSILHKKSRFNGIYEIELWREKNTRRDLSWAYNFLVSWGFRLHRYAKNHKIIWLLSVQNSFNSSCSLSAGEAQLWLSQHAAQEFFVYISRVLCLSHREPHTLQIE